MAKFKTIKEVNDFCIKLNEVNNIKIQIDEHLNHLFERSIEPYLEYYFKDEFILPNAYCHLDKISANNVILYCEDIFRGETNDSYYLHFSPIILIMDAVDLDDYLEHNITIEHNLEKDWANNKYIKFIEK